MNYKFYSGQSAFAFIFFVSLSLMSLAGDAQACSCTEYGEPPCAAYWRADAVFVGRVYDITPLETGEKELPMQLLHFTVEQSFRGVDVTNIKVATLHGTSCDTEIKRGQRWFVYGYRNETTGRFHIQPCTRTTRLDDADDGSEDFAYARGAARGATTQSLSGKILKGDYEPLKAIKVTVEGEGKMYEATTNDEGGFTVNLERAGAYTVRAVVPFSAMVVSYREGFREQATEEQTVVEYNVSIEAGRCDYREIHAHEIDLKATAEISGRVFGADGLPTPDVRVYLVSAEELGGKPEKQGVPHKTFGYGSSTDMEGRYTFGALREGHYALVVNPDGMPEVNSPYPRTYYPGVQDVASAVIVNLEQGQQLSKQDIQLPPKLIERKVTGVMVWADGKPVTRLAPDSSPDVLPFLSIYDPHRLWYSLNPRRADGTRTVEVDKRGRFSFIGFEGYTYVITANALDRKNKPRHARAVKLTITKKTKQLKLVLSLPGSGGQEDIKKELSEQSQVVK
ncbi:MAG: carboxypeptidase-like regulatory domain-containing protein [Pyrinomonadaceae bacterium MAG19_C2-C3]|nr:carboxypeptidase-like regulatory domain-containing protein [Pyrinomonadaceae bacterium MAG19_C2-C3]